MKLFISYSRDDKAWVYELWRALRDRAHHDAWIDQRIVPAQDWWDTILTNVEKAESVLYVMTPKSVESIYCLAEVMYAVELNKPIVPLMLKSCDNPAELKRRRIQYEIVDDNMALGDVLFVTERALGEIRVGLLQGKYAPPSPAPSRPDEPKPARKPEQVSEVFMLAEEAASVNNISLAEKLFRQVIDTDPNGYGLAAVERLGEIRAERERQADYLNVAQMAANPALRKGARALWRVYVTKYGTDYDPNGLAAVLAAPAIPSLPARPRVMDILPPPFEWIEIPKGEVNLITEKGWPKNYVPEGQSRAFDVPPFAIAKYPVTNAQYAGFVEAGGYNEAKWWTEAGWEARETGWNWNPSRNTWEPTGNTWAEPQYSRDDSWNGKEYPVVGVSWYEAVAFCQWLSETSGEEVMLPTEQQWQRAAQGNDGREYPWGNDKPNEQLCNFGRNVGKTTPVTQYPLGASCFGVMDMAGNVWEWCLTTFKSGRTALEGEAARVLRGGSWNGPRSVARCAYRDGNNPYLRLDARGFRVVCARPPSP